MKNFISDKQIINWNENLKDSPYLIKPLYSRTSSYPGITIWQKVSVNGYMSTLTMTSVNGNYDQLEQTIDPHFKYKFTFSVSSNRVGQFNDILDHILKLPTGTYFSYKENSYNIEISDKVIESKSEEDHMILNKSYKRITYNFSGKLSHVVMYVNSIIDTISFFELMWGYHEDGNEQCLLEYPIGSIVSIKSDKSKDFLVVDYSYNKNTNDIYTIDYVCCEMLNTKSPIIKYGNVITYNGKDLCFSRNNRIDDILN